MNRNKKVIVCAHCSNDLPFVDQWYKCWSKADEIYIVIDNSTDGTLEKFQSIANTDPHLHIFNCFYTTFRFDLIRNDLQTFLPDEEAFYLYPCLDTWFLEEDWKEKLLFYFTDEDVLPRYSFGFNEYKDILYNDSFLVFLMDDYFNFSNIVIDDTFIHHPSMREIISIYYGKPSRFFNINAGPGEGRDSIVSTIGEIRVTKDKNTFIKIHLFHAILIKEYDKITGANAKVDTIRDNSSAVNNTYLYTRKWSSEQLFISSIRSLLDISTHNESYLNIDHNSTALFMSLSAILELAYSIFYIERNDKLFQKIIDILFRIVKINRPLIPYDQAMDLNRMFRIKVPGDKIMINNKDWSFIR